MKIIKFCTKSENTCHQKIPTDENTKCPTIHVRNSEKPNKNPHCPYKIIQINIQLKKVYLFIYHNLQTNLQCLSKIKF